MNRSSTYADLLRLGQQKIKKINHIFDEIEYLIKSSELPSGTKVSLAVLTAAIKWLVWPFVGVGLLIKIDFFPYWLAFFVLIESILFLTLVYLLISIARHELGLKEHKGMINHPEQKISSLFKSIQDGITGNISFYLFIVIGFIILKFLGVFDDLLIKLTDLLK